MMSSAKPSLDAVIGQRRRPCQQKTLRELVILARCAARHCVRAVASLVAEAASSVSYSPIPADIAAEPG